MACLPWETPSLPPGSGPRSGRGRSRGGGGEALISIVLQKVGTTAQSHRENIYFIKPP